jgi:hydrogenase maturation protease
MRILVLGVGNVLLSDEGVGVRVVEALARRYRFPENVEVMDGGTAGMELLDTIARSHRVIVVDAVRTGRPPATRVRLAGEEVPAFFRTRISPHQVGLSDLFATLQITGESPDSVVLLGVEPVSLETGLDLTPAVAAQVENLIDAVLSELEEAGAKVMPAGCHRSPPVTAVG